MDPARPEKDSLPMLIFPTQLGWIGLVCSGQSVQRLTLGHPDAASAAANLGRKTIGLEKIQRTYPVVLARVGERKFGNQTEKKPDSVSRWQANLIDRLWAYSAGQMVDFRDVAVDPGPTTPFQARIYALCRQIPYGSTITYGQLAQLAGSPRAGRAVGQALARNPIPILIPCHRVVGIGGKLVGFTAPGGLAMKQRLLQLEAAASPPPQPPLESFSEKAWLCGKPIKIR